MPRTAPVVSVQDYYKLVVGGGTLNLFRFLQSSHSLLGTCNRLKNCIFRWARGMGNHTDILFHGPRFSQSFGFDFLQKEETFLYSAASRPDMGPFQRPIQWVSGALSLGVIWLERKSNHSLPSSAEVKNGGAIHTLPHTSSQGDH
jgi:hypothetical protein